MESLNENALYDDVAGNVRNNIKQINMLLENCSIQSEVTAQENKIIEFLSLDTDALIIDEPKADYYDLSKVTKILEMLESPKPERKKKLRRLESTLSTLSLLSTTSSQSSEDLRQPENYKTEIVNHLTGIRSVLEKIQNSSIICPDLKAIKDKETAKNVKFCDLVMSLQKFAKELRNIALSDKVVSDHESLKINEKLLTDLDHLSQVSLFKYLRREVFN